jgi:hypothetical protein
VCVCVCERESEKESERETARERERGPQCVRLRLRGGVCKRKEERERERERERAREGAREGGLQCVAWDPVRRRLLFHNCITGGPGVGNSIDFFSVCQKNIG